MFRKTESYACIIVVELVSIIISENFLGVQNFPKYPKNCFNENYKKTIQKHLPRKKLKLMFWLIFFQGAYEQTTVAKLSVWASRSYEIRQSSL